MPATPTAAHEAPLTRSPQHDSADSPARTSEQDLRDTRTRRHQPARPAHPPTDDEILGLDTASPRTPDPAQATFDFDAPSADAKSAPASENASAVPSNAPDPSAEPANFRNIFEANPELRQAWQDANAYRETFATPEAARAATAQLADLDRMDALFFSRRPEDHAELARVVATLDPNAFASLAQAITALASGNVAQVFRPEAFRPSSGAAQSANDAGRLPDTNTWRDVPHSPAPAGRHSERSVPSSSLREAPGHAVEESLSDAAATSALATPPAPSRAPTPAQAEFFHAANAAAVEGVLDAIESQVERLLPEGVSKSARNRVVGEIYRELDTTLRSNRQLGQQMRDAFRHGSLDPDHQRAIVSLVTGRARQALPAVAKRVLNEWTSTIVAANNDRRSASPRSVDYARMSDSDILNL